MKKTIGEKWHEIIRMERLKKEETARKGKYEEIKIEKDHFWIDLRLKQIGDLPSDDI